MRREGPEKAPIKFRIVQRIFFEGLSLLFFASLVLGCTRSRPVDFRPGEFHCEFCQMSIVDMRFKAEILSPKGKVHRFDSIECMLRWQMRYSPEESAGRWVTDFYHPEKWIELEKAHLLKSERLASPMGAFLSAYSTPEDRALAQKEYGGGPIEPKTLLEELKKNPFIP